MRRRDLLAGGGALAVSQALPLPALARLASDPPELGDAHVRYVHAGTPEATHTAAAFRTPRTPPKLRALCRSSQAVSALVTWARERDLGFAIRSGGHNFAGVSHHPELVIDTRHLDTATFDAATETLTVGPGATIADAVAATGDAGRSIPIGTCPSVGLAGLALGGGIGFFTRHAGLTCDALQAVDIVDADGRLREASASSHPDLFWACQGGGGGSFGVVTRMRFSTFAVPRVVHFDYKWGLPVSAASALVAMWQNWALSDDHAIGSILSLSPHLMGSVLVRLVGIGVGSRADVERHVAPFEGAGMLWAPPVVLESTLTAAMAEVWTTDHNASQWSRLRAHVAAEPLSSPALEGLCDLIASNQVSATLEPLGGAAADIGTEATAFPHRGKRQVVVHIAGPSREPGSDLEGPDTSDLVHDHVATAVAGADYANYPDEDARGSVQAYWGINADRLKEVKRRYDSSDVFRHSHGIAAR